MKKFCLYILFLLGLSTSAQTIVSGIVTTESGEPIPYANILFKGTSIGVYSSDNGTFYLESNDTQKALVVSSVGFTEAEIQLTKNKTTNLKIILKEGEQLSEVVIIAKPKKALSKKENPAYKILQQIWKNKKKFGFARADYYQYQQYKVLEVGLNNVDTAFMKTALGKEHENIQKILSKNKREYYQIPMYLTETIEEVYGNNKDSKERIDKKAERIKGVVQKGFGMQRIAEAMKPFNIYDNNLMILDKPFVSPIAEFGYGTYLYVLSDTIVENNKKYYQIHFFPRVDEDLALQGQFLVADSTFALKSINMFTTKKTNINLVRGLSFEQEFESLNDTTVVLKKDMYEADFTLFTKNDKEKGLYVRNIVNYSDFQLNKPQPTSFYDGKIEQISSKQFLRDEEFWKNNEIGDRDLSNTKIAIDKIGNNRKVKGVSDAIDMIGSGFIYLGNHFQLGSFWEAFGMNDVEGLRIRLGFRSFTSTDDRFRTYFYGAMGTRDKKFKYGVTAMYLLCQQPRITIGGMYTDDYEQLGGPAKFTNINSLRMRTRAVSLISKGENYFLTQNQKIHGIIDYAVHTNLHFAVMATHRQMESADEEHFSIQYQKEGKVKNHLTDFSTGISILYTPGRNVQGYGVEQRYGRNLFSSYSLAINSGVKGVANGDFDYTQVQASIEYPIPVRQFGLLNTTFDFGKIWGQVPLSLLSPTPSNQTYSSTKRSFGLLDYYDFVTDTYVNGYFEHHFNGYIFNKIPLVKKLGLRGLLLANFAYGTISEENKSINQSSIIYNAPEKLYWEYGFGIENIGYGNFRPFRIDFMWRSQYNDVNGIKNPEWGIMFGIFPDF